MAVALDAVMTGGNDGGDVQSVSAGTSFSAASLITVGASATLLVVGCSFLRQGTSQVPTGISATWNGDAMSAGPTAQRFGNPSVLVAIFYRINPAAGANTLAVSWTGASDLYCGAASFTGTDTSTGINAADNQTNSGTTGTSSNVTITTVSGDATVGVSCADSNDPTVAFTKFYGAADLAPGGAGDYKLSTGTSDAHTYSYSAGQVFAGAGIHILAAGGGTNVTGLTAVAAVTAVPTPTFTMSANPAVTAVAAVTAIPTPSVTTGAATSVTPLTAVAAVTAVPQPGIAVSQPVIAKIADRGIRTSTSAGDAVVDLPTAGAITVGNYLVARVAVDNSGASGARPGLAVSDARNGTWTTGTGALRDPAGASAGIVCYLSYVKVASGYTNGDDVTFDYTTGSPLSAIVIEEWSFIDGTTPLAVAEVQASNLSTTADPSVSRTPTAAGQLMYAACAIEGQASVWGAQDSDTTDGSWVDVTKDTADTGTGSTSVTVYGGYKIVTGTSAQTWDNSVADGLDWAAVAVVFARATETLSITAVCVTATTAIPTPAVTTSGATNVTPITAVAAVTAIPTPTFTAPCNVTGLTAVAAVTAIPTPGVSAGVNVSVTAVAAVSTVGARVTTGLYPASISNRKLLDQYGNVYLARPFSSWGMFKITDAEITTALEGVASRHFNGVTVWIGGGARFNTTWLPYYENDDGENYWTGTAWQSSLGPAWSTIDWIVSECARLGLVAHLSLGISFGTTGPAADILAASNAQMRQVGIDVATRYLPWSNIVWHVMFDDTPGPGSTTGGRVEAYFDGINDTEGPTRRPVRWCEVNTGSTTNEQGWLNTTDAKFSINCLYEYTGTSVEHVEAVWAEVTDVPVGDCEPVYDGASHYGGNMGQQLRERNYAVFLEGGCLINWGSEAWWAFGPPDRYGLVADNETLDDWTLVPDHVHTVQAQYAWDLFDAYVADTTWLPTSSFVTTGAGTGETKAAVGLADTAAVAYFPDSRTIQVDTTVLTGTGNVRLRWYDPTDGTYTSIASSEAQQSGRSITYPSAHGDSTNDWVLVVDLAGGDVSPSTVTAVTAIPTPTVTTGVSATPTVVAAVTAVATPTITVTSTPTPTVITAVTAIATPSITTGVSPAVTVVAAVTAVPTPTLTAPCNVTGLAAVAAVTAVPAPTLTAPCNITGLTAVPAVTAIPTPAITTGVSPAVGAVAAITAVSAPTVTVTTLPAPTVVVAVTAVPTPSVSTGNDQAVAVSSVTAAVAIPTPAVAGTQVAPSAVAAVTAIPAPVVSTSRSVTVTAVTAVTAVPTPTVDRTTLPGPAAVAALATVPTPAISAALNILVTVVSAVTAFGTVTVNTGEALGGTATQSFIQSNSATQTIRKTGTGTITSQGATQELNP